MFIRFPATPGGLPRSLSVSRPDNKGEVLITPRAPTSAQQPSDPAAEPAADSTLRLPNDPDRKQPPSKP